MSTLVWDDRGYETGIDRGVLYLNTIYPGVPWNGLVSVEESAVGGEIETKHLDGINYLTVALGRYFQAVVSAFSAPREFSDYIGDKLVIPGFHITQQPKQRFNFSYRVTTDDGYDIHIVYNCLASQTDETNASIGESIEPELRSWTFDATPAILPDMRPTAHFIINSVSNPTLVAELEDLLYGTPSLDPNCPTPIDLIAMFD